MSAIVHFTKKTPQAFTSGEKKALALLRRVRGGSNVDLLLTAEIADKSVDAAKELARQFGIDTGDEKPKRKALTIA